MLPHIHTLDGITVVVNGRSYSVAASDAAYQELVGLVETGAPEAMVEDLLQRTAKKLKETLRLAPDMEYSGGVVRYQGEVLHNYAVDRLVTLIEADRPYAPVANFLAKLQANPSKRVVDNLYSFLEKGSIPITEDGDFLAYKAVRPDYKDIHSGKFDNSVGSVCEMPRNRVDEDPNRTCSAGLHVCSFSYLPHFAHANGHVMLCKVSPADVVAIPADYNDAKMRVSKYEVVDEMHGYYTANRDILAEAGQSIGVIEAEFDVIDGDSNPVASYFTLDEAKRQAEALFARDGGGWSGEVTVQDDEGYVLYTVDEDGGH